MRGRMGGMRYRKLKIVVAVLVAMTCYFAGYVLLGHRVCAFQDPQTKVMFCGSSYPYAWEAKAFIPAAAIESYVLKRNRVVGTEDELIWESPDRENTNTPANE
jgi:hypothetical protein